MGGGSSDFLAAGRERVVGEYFQILWLREGARGLWVSIFRFCGCGKEGGADGCWHLGFVCFFCYDCCTAIMRAFIV